MVHRGASVANADRPHDPYEEDTLYPKLGHGAGAGADDCYHGDRGLPTILWVCSGVANAAFAFGIFSMADHYLAGLLYADAGGESLVYS